LAATSLQLILPNGDLKTGVDLVAFGALFTWAWQEMFEGVNYFRRALGLVVLVGMLALKFARNPQPVEIHPDEETRNQLVVCSNKTVIRLSDDKATNTPEVSCCRFFR